MRAGEAYPTPPGRKSLLASPGALRVVEGTIAAVAVLLLLQYSFRFSLGDPALWVLFRTPLIAGIQLSLVLIGLTIPLSVGVGFLVGWARLSRYRFLSWPAAIFVDFFRGIPLLVLILFAFFFGPRLIPGPLAIRLAPDIFQLSLISAALALALHSAAYQAEIFRAGLQSVSRGQVEASHALGMDGWQAMRHVILPQALRLSLPPLGNELAVLIKDTSFLYIVGFAEMFYQAWQLMGSLGREGAPIQWSLAFLTTIAAIYFGLTYVVTRSLRMVEKRVGAPGMGVASL